MATAPATPVKAPFFSTAIGRAIIKAALTALMIIIPAVLNDPAVAAFLGSVGGANTIMSLVRDLLDPAIANLP